MNKQLKFTYKDKDFTLEYTRESIKRMEREGFSVSKLENSIVTQLPLLFRGAFYSKHPKLNQAVIDEIYENFTNKQELVGVLGKMIADPINVLFEEPKDTKNAISWEVDF